jgi:hypothetical protein
MDQFPKGGACTARLIAELSLAARQLFALKQHYSGKLKLTDVKEMFLQMRDGSGISVCTPLPVEHMIS